MPILNVPGCGPVFVCQSCLSGEHCSYGDAHMATGDDCKNIENGRKCCCHPAWPELQAELNKEIK